MILLLLRVIDPAEEEVGFRIDVPIDACRFRMLLEVISFVEWVKELLRNSLSDFAGKRLARLWRAV